MTEVVTYIRCQINDKWTNLGIIADEDEINEHFEFVQDLLMQKQRADELEREKNEAVLALFNQKDYYGKLVDEEKQRADRLENQLNSLKEYIPSLRSAIESTLYYSHPDIEQNLQSDIGSYSSLMEQICKDLEEDGE